MKFKEVRRLRPLPQKRVRELLVDFESDCETELDTTLDDSTMSQSMFDDSLGTRSESRWKQENGRLKQENANLRAELEATKKELARFKDFFKVTKKPTKANGSGSCDEFGSDLTIIALEAMSDTSEARTVHRVMESLARHMDLINAEDECRRVPRPDWFVKTRSKLDGLLKHQRDDFMEQGGPFFISFDATNLHSNNVVSMVVFNKDLEYLNFGYKEIAAKTGVQIAATMRAMIREHDGLEQNLEALITDRCASQLLANRLLIDMINAERSPENFVFAVTCHMHTSLGCDNRSWKQLSSDAQAIGKGLQISFGGRKSDGWRKDSLKKSLESLLGITSEFESTIGSRFRVGMANGSALWRHEDEVHAVLSGSSRPRHAEMITVMDGPTWPRIRLELGIPVLVWTSIIGPFHSTTSGRANYGQVKLEFQIAFRKLGKIRSSKSPFSEAIAICKEQVHDSSSTTPEAIRLIEATWNRGSNRILRNQLNEVAMKAFDQVFDKLSIDWNVTRDLPIEDSKVMEWTNRKVESAFAYLKQVDRKYTTLANANLQMISLAKMNHLSSWLQTNSHRVSSASAKADYYELRRKRESEFTLEMAVDEFLSALE